MAKYLSLQDIVKKVVDKKIAIISKPTFLEAVSRGQIPYHYIEGSKTKKYIYSEVKEAMLKAGIGQKGFRDMQPPKSKKSKNKSKKEKHRERIIEKLDNIKPPEKGQTQQQYGEQVVHELGEKPTVTDANIYKTIYQGKIEKIKYEKLMGELIERDKVENKAFETARAIRDKLLTIPERLSSELSSISDAHQIKELLFKEFEILLDGFSEESFYVKEH